MVPGTLGGFSPDTRRLVRGPGGFVLSEVKKRPLTTFLGMSGPVIPIRQHGSAMLCLDCGAVSADFTVDVEEATTVMEKWATEDLKLRMDIGEETV